MAGLNGVPLLSLATATAAGLIIGIERGWSQREQPDGARVSGVRTFGLLGLAGGLAGLFPDTVAAALLLVAGLLLVVGYRGSVRPDTMSATTAVAGVLTLGIGMTAVRIGATVALASAASVFALLNARHALHRMLRGLSEDEIEATARFLLVALVVLPLLPDRAYGPFDAWNPRGIWLVVVMVAGLSFAGYAAARRWGSSRSILLIAATGAIVSSTAVTAAYARRLRSEPAARPALAAGIAIASIIMFVRVQVLTLILVPRVLPALAMVMAPATVVASVFALAAWRRGQSEQSASPVQLGNPLDFRPALLLAAMVAVLSLVARWALVRFGDSGMAVVLALTGMMDVDAAVLTLAGLPAGAIGDRLGGFVLAGPVLANTVIKAGMTLAIAPGRDGMKAAAPLLAAFAASGVMLAITLA